MGVEGRRYSLRRLVATSAAALLVGAGAGYAAAQRPTYEVDIRPGGVWISPENGQHISGNVHLEAQAYPTKPKDPPVAFVNFTAEINGTWQTVCRVTPPPPTEVPKFGCDWIPPSTDPEIKLSFDVYDAKKNVNEQPHGPRTIFVSS
jgi:hypothetical protein